MKAGNTLKALLFIGTISGSMAAMAAGGHAAWGYAGGEGPAHWGMMSKAYTSCSAGKSQSPVNLMGGSGHVAGPAFSYKTSDLSVLNNGHTVQVNYGAGSKITLDGSDYELKQFHVHTPSEHTIDGKHFPMEIHFVHANARGELAVVGVMVKEGKENAALAPMLSNAPAKPGTNKVSGKNIDAAAILPANLKSVYRYSGSLTTPPCSEGVNWTIMTTPIQASSEQLQGISKMLHHNNRPVQAMNGRKLSTN